MAETDIGSTAMTIMAETASVINQADEITLQLWSEVKRGREARYFWCKEC